MQLNSCMWFVFQLKKAGQLLPCYLLAMALGAKSNIPSLAFHSCTALHIQKKMLEEQAEGKYPWLHPE